MADYTYSLPLTATTTDYAKYGYMPQYPFEAQITISGFDRVPSNPRDYIDYIIVEIYPGYVSTTPETLIGTIWFSYNGEDTWTEKFEFPTTDKSDGYSLDYYYFRAVCITSFQQEVGVYASGYLDGVRGQIGSAAATTISATASQYSQAGEGQVVVEVTEVLDAAHPATFLRSNSTGAIIEWYVTCPGAGEYTLEQAKSRGYISNYYASSSRTYNKGDPAYGEFVSYGQLYFTPKVAGEFQVRAKLYYVTARQFFLQQIGVGYYNLVVAEHWTEKATPRIYSESNPTFEVKTVTPAEFMQGNTNPLDGMPPYTVVWKDTTKQTDPLQIPQSQILYDFGDAETGQDNFATYVNPTDEITVAPDVTHVYSGYGPYTCRMTIVDKAGNETSSSVQFSPSVAPRMIKPPTLTPLEGNQPLLVEGNAFVAGKPEPAAHWSYELLGNESGYYQGEKEGKYVEMSLLAGGQYAVTCDIVDVSGVVLETNSFGVEVMPDPLYQDNPVRMNNFDVWVYDENGERVDLLQPVSQARYIDRYAHEKAVTFQVPIDYPYLQRLRKDCIFDFGYLGAARRMVVVSYVEESDGLTVTIEGKDFVSYVLGYRVATVSTRSTSGNGKDIQRCSGEALLQYFVVANLNTSLRDVPLLHLIGENQDRGEAVEYSARYDKTSDILDSICTSSGLGWDVSLQATSPESVGFKVVEGVDRTYSSENPIVFSGRIDGLRNADVGAYSEYSSPNVAIGAGAGDGATRDYTEYGETGFSGMFRREVFVDAGDKASEDEVRLTCLAKLKNLEDNSLYVYPNADAQWKFGVDYNVGDYVTIETRSGIMMDMQIVSAELSNFDGEGEVLLLKCGVDERETRTILRELELGNTYSKK